LQRLHNFASAVEKHHVNGVPLHVAHPNRSVFSVIPHAKYKSMTVGEVQDVLRRHHIVVTDMPTKDLSFDERGLGTLKSLTSVVTMQGIFSIPIS
jgi:hypothetical protein